LPGRVHARGAGSDAGRASRLRRSPGYAFRRRVDISAGITTPGIDDDGQGRAGPSDAGTTGTGTPPRGCLALDLTSVRDEKLLAALRQARELAGATPGTLEVFLAVRGARTLAERLARHPKVTLTRYPGLASHPTHEAARRQLKGFGTIISFGVRGDAADADAVCTGLQLVQHATSLGAVESTIERRVAIPGQEHRPPTLLRLSVGIEAVEDLRADLGRALRKASA